MSYFARPWFPLTRRVLHLVRSGLRWCFSRRALKPAAVLLTLVAVAWQFENWRARRAWAAVEQRLSARGESLDWRDSFPTPLPDEQNAARHPVFSPALIGTLPERPGDWSPPDANWHETKPHGGLGYKYDFSKLLPPLETAIVESSLFNQQAAFPDLAAAQAFLRADPGITWPDAPVSAADDVLWATRTLEPFIDGINEAFQRPGYDLFPLRADLSETPAEIPIGIATDITRFSTHFFRLASLRCQAHLAKQDTTAAARDLMTVIHLSKPLLTRRHLVSALVELAVNNISGPLIQSALEQPGWQEPDLAEISDALSQFVFLKDLDGALKNEMLSGLTVILWAKDHPAKPWPAPHAFSPRKAAFWEGMLWFATSRTAPAACYYQNAVTLAGLYQDHVMSRYDPATRLLRRDVPDMGEARRRMPVTPYTCLARISIPMLSNIHETAAKAQTRLDQCRLLCALQRHRLRHGTLPASLSALTPAFIEQIPHDYITGQPMRYDQDTAGTATLTSETWPHITTTLRPQ